MMNNEQARITSIKRKLNAVVDDVAKLSLDTPFLPEKLRYYESLTQSLSSVPNMTLSEVSEVLQAQIGAAVDSLISPGMSMFMDFDNIDLTEVITREVISTLLSRRLLRMLPDE